MPSDEATLAPEMRLALTYAGEPVHAEFRSIFALNARCDSIVRKIAEPLPAQFRLAWHRGVLLGEPAAGEGDPEMRAIVQGWRGIPSELVPIVDGWEEVLAEQPDLDAAAFGMSQSLRSLAKRAGCLPGECDAASRAGKRWYATLLALSRQARGEAADFPAQTGPIDLPPVLRPLAILDGLALRAARQGRPALMGDRLSPLVAIRLGIFGR